MLVRMIMLKYWGDYEMYILYPVWPAHIIPSYDFFPLIGKIRVSTGLFRDFWQFAVGKVWEFHANLSIYHKWL